MGAILTSPTVTRLAWEGDELRGDVEMSVFTRFLIDTGAVAPDSLETTLEQLYEYARIGRRVTPNMASQRWVDGLRDHVAPSSWARGSGAGYEESQKRLSDRGSCWIGGVEDYQTAVRCAGASVEG